MHRAAEERHRERGNELSEHSRVVKALGARLLVGDTRVITLTTQLAEQTARTQHAEEKVEQMRSK